MVIKKKVNFVLSSQPPYMELIFKTVDKWYLKKKPMGHYRGETGKCLLSICFYWIFAMFKI